MFDRVGRITTAITPHSSRMSANYLQGAAATIALSGDLDLTAFVSYRKIDATLAGDSAIRTRLATGYHRTPSEMERKNNASEWLMGGRLSWQHGHWQAGLTALANGYDLPLQRAGDVLLADYVVKGARPPFSIKSLIHDKLPYDRIIEPYTCL